MVTDAHALQEILRAVAPFADWDLLRKAIGSITFSMTVSVGNSWKNWKTSPTLPPRQPASPDSDNEPRSAPAAWMVPEVGRSIPASRFQQRRLAAARPTHDRDEFSLRDIEAEMVNRDDLTGRERIRLDDVA